MITIILLKKNYLGFLPIKLMKQFIILWVGLLMGAVGIGVQSWAIHVGNDKWMTMVFTVLSISQMGQAMAVRSERQSLFKQGIFGNKQLAGAVLLTLGLQMAVIYIPFLQDIFSTKALSIKELLLCLGVSSIVFWAVEIEKWVKRIKNKPLNNTARK